MCVNIYHLGMFSAADVSDLSQGLSLSIDNA